MPLGLISDITVAVPRNVRLLGLDLGTKTIGLALCDMGQSIATPLKTIARTRFQKDMHHLGAILSEYEIGGLVFGWPLNMDGTVGAACERVRSFIDEMKRYPQDLGIEPGMDLWIALQDERLSTATVNDFLINTVDISRTKRAKVVDKLAAQVILQNALDYLNSKKV